MKHKFGKAWKDADQLPEDIDPKFIACVRFGAEVACMGYFDPELKMFRYAVDGEPVLELIKWAYLPVRLEDL